MKALSLWQPWASLIATGAKRYETRSWETRYRGPLLICAAKGGIPRREIKSMLTECEFQGGLAPLVEKPLSFLGPDHIVPWADWPGVRIEHLPFGVAVCLVDLVECIRTERLTPEQIGTDEPFGDFHPGRFAWKLERVRPVHPFVVKGSQGLFDVLMPGEFPK